MSDNIMIRDRQVGLENAWHRKTMIVPEVTRELATPYEVEAHPLYFNKDGKSHPTGSSMLIATDDNLPVGDPYNPETYFPGSIEVFWKTLIEGLGDTPFKIVSAGSVCDRRKVFASVKISEDFTIGGRPFKEYLTLIDSFDKSHAMTASYSSICAVCDNTVTAILSGFTNHIARAKHTASFSNRREQVCNAIDAFAGTSAKFKELLEQAAEQPTTKDDARAFIMSVEGRNVSGAPTNGLLQKVARMMELFESGKGNEGRTRLDAFQGITEFHTHESTNRKDPNSQYLTSEWGTSAATKTIALRGLGEWDRMVTKGKTLLEKSPRSVLATA